MSKFSERISSLAEGRHVKSVRLGYNPNSSSLGVYVSALLYGTLSIAIAAPLIAMGIRLLKKRKDGK